MPPWAGVRYRSGSGPGGRESSRPSWPRHSCRSPWRCRRRPTMEGHTSSSRCSPSSPCSRLRAACSPGTAPATLPAGVIWVTFHRQVEAAASLLLVGTGFLVTGFMNWSTRRLAGSRPAPTVGVAVGIGFAQALAAVFRGVSRSGSTVCAALWGGLGPAAAAEFSFLLAVPVIAGAALVEGRHMVVSVAAVGAVPLAVSFALAFAGGIWSIRFLVALLQRGHFYRFAPYNWIVGVLTIVYALWRG